MSNDLLLTMNRFLEYYRAQHKTTISINYVSVTFMANHYFFYHTKTISIFSNKIISMEK